MFKLSIKSGVWGVTGGLIAAVVVVSMSPAPAGVPSANRVGRSAARAPRFCHRLGAETVRTDKPRYAHHRKVHITGSSFRQGCDVAVRVIEPDGSVSGGRSPRRGRGVARVTSSGKFSYDYRLGGLDGRYLVEVAGAAGAVLAHTSFMDAFGLQKLLLGSTTGPEDYAFTAGNTVYAQGSVDAATGNTPNRSYRFTFTDPSGAARATTACTANGPNSVTVFASYALQATDPVSTASEWHVVLRQYTDRACTALEKTSSSLAFDVAKPTTYSSSALTTQQSVFRAGSTAFMRIVGLKVAQTGWSTTWNLPAGTTACANTAGTDRPSSDSAGALPSGAALYLQYAPGVVGSTWNLQSNYDAGSTCPAFSTANAGSWGLTLRSDATHFVALPAFVVDATAPTSSATSPPSTGSPNVTVSYTASDDNGGAGLASVDLYAKAPGDASYSKVATDSTPSGSGSFAYAALKGDGSYSFYTISTDKVGNAESAPASADTITLVDTTAPTSTASSPQYAKSTTVSIPYTASDGGSGLAKVELYAKAPGDASYSKVATDSTPGGSGSLSYTTQKGDGNYSFYTIATDKAGNAETAPSNADSSMLLDTGSPASSASSPALSGTPSFAVSYTASDNTGGSGLAKVDLYAKGPGDASYSKVATDSAPGGTGSLSYTAQNGDGTYRFYTIATDKAGNAESAPADADSTSVVDAAAPSSAASAPQYATSANLTVSYSASAGPTGLAKVELYAKGPGDASYSKVATDASPGVSGSFTYAAQSGDGSYAFYTIATGQNGNVESVPGSADSTTLLDRAAPSSQAQAPPASTTASFAVPYSAGDGSGSGLATVDLYAKGPNDSSYAKVATDTTPTGSGSFSYTARQGSGNYGFYTVSTDKVGNTEVKAGADGTTAVTLPVDRTSPSSSAFSPQYSTSPSFTVSYAASDDAGGAGLARVDVYVKGPGDSSYSRVATDSAPSGAGSFNFTGSKGDGSYSFYTIATDLEGNVEAVPSSADSTTVLDTVVPASAASSPQYSTSTSVTVSYSASAGSSGLAKVELYAKGPGDASYSKVATDSAPGGSGSFSYGAQQGDGVYSFYTVATSGSGTVESAPASADSTTLLDTAAPTASSTTPAYATTTNITVSFSAADNAGGSGLANVDLYAKGPGDLSYAKVASANAPTGSGSFSYTAANGDGAYSFYVIATDRAGNVEATPAGPDGTTQVDTTAPASSATSPQYATSTTFTVSYTGSDAGTGLATVDLYGKGPGDSSYSKLATDPAPSGSGSFSFTASKGDGSYSFYTLATDKAGNAESAPANGDSTTQLDTSPPSSHASSPLYSTSSTFTVPYTADDGGGSGLARVDLYALGPADSNYTKVASKSAPAGSGTFTYTATQGEGAYSFYTVATDNAGGTEPKPDDGDPTTPSDSTTRYDRTAPASQATSPAYANTPSFTVSYNASDTNSGLATVDLYVKGPSDSSYSKAATDPAPGTTGSFDYNGTQGNGNYSFYTVATDNAGNAEATPGSSDTTTTVDPNAGKTDVVDELHYTFTGPTSVAFDWRGAATDIRYGTTTSYGKSATAGTPNPLPFSSPGPFRQVQLTNLLPGTTYHYSIGGGVDHTFATAPTGNFRFDVEGDIGSTRDYPNVGPIQSQIAGDNPAFVITDGDLTYGTPFGQASVDQAFNDIMAWSAQAADMPSWGNHEWEAPATDDLRNYKGRFMLPNAQTSPSAPAAGCCGQDWSWFDAGGVRFINYPEPYTSSTWSDWQQNADAIFAAAQADPSIHFIVTFGHRPAYSTGFHPGQTSLATVLNAFGDKYSKYVLNLNGHSHDYERFQPIHGVTHITTGGGGGALETPWTSTDPNTAFRAFHLEHLRIDVSSTGMRIDAICGPPTSLDDISCVQGTVIDSVTIGSGAPPPPPPPPTLYVEQTNSNCSDSGSGTATQPFCSLRPAATRVVAGQTVLVGNGTYREQLSPLSSGTGSKPIVFAAEQGATPTITGVSNGVYIQSLSYITVQGFTVTGTSGDAVVVRSSQNITIRGNHISFAGQPAQGLIAKGFRGDAITDSVIANNTVDHNTDYGIYLFDGSTRNQIVGNHVFGQARGYQRAASGIRLYGSTDNTISANYSYNNEDSGIEFFNNAGGNFVNDNVLYGNGDHGVDDNNAPCQTIVANSVYNNFTAGINLEGDSPGGVVENNISVDNAINSTRTRSNIRVDATSVIAGTCVDGTPASGPTVDYNLVNLSSPGTMYAWGNSLYTSLSAFQAGTGQEAHGVQASPHWADASNGDFHLEDDSPAIDAANSAANGQPPTDADGHARVDDPYVHDTGAGPETFHDRGAFELEPEPPPDQAPYASLTVTPDSGTAPVSVTADASASTDTDANGIATYTFDFGDGSPVVGPQAAATATHVYRSVGVHTVKVTVNDTAGLGSSSTKQVLVRDAPPTTAITLSPASGPAPLQVSADASGSVDDDSTPIASYTFDFGDGSAVVGPQAGATAGHTYPSAGTYTVTVTATDTAGNTSSSSTQATVTTSAGDDLPPAVSLAVTPASGTAPIQVTADASASTDMDMTPIASYKFDFGDGSAPIGPQAGGTVSHTYAAAGTYTVKVTVADTAGNASTATQQVTVSAPDLAPAAALAVAPGSDLAPMAVTADASASTDNDVTPIATYKFNFGDGTAAVGPQATATAAHTYQAAGTYTVTVTVTDTVGNASTATRQVTAYANLVTNAGFETNTAGWNTSGGGTGITLTRVAGGRSGNWAVQVANTNTTNQTCLLNDSPNAISKTSAGQYTGSLWVRADTAGATLNLRFREYSTSGTLLLTSAKAVPLATSWQRVTVTHSVSSPGSTLDFNAYVLGAPPGSTCFYADDAAIYNGSALEAAPNAALSVTPTSGIGPLQVRADASASTDTDATGIASYTFDFGDGTATVGPQAGAVANHNYTVPGAHNVKVTVTDTAGNSSTTTTKVTVGDAPPNAALSVSPTSGPTPLQVTADASGSSDPDSTGVANYTFDFGDGTDPVGPQSSPTAGHRYTSLGTHTVSVTVTDTAGNASSTTRQVLVIDNPPAASLSVTPNAGTAPLQVTADGSGSSDTDATPIASYRFDFGDGTAAVGPQAASTAPHTYSAAGTYTVTMTVTDTAGNSSTATRQVTVSPPLDLPPNAVLNVTPTSGTAPLQVTADGSGSSDTDATPIATYKFDFGDGTAAVGPQAGATAGHMYSAAGTYTVTMTVTDTGGNSSSATTQVTVTDNAPDSPPAAAINVTPASGTAPLNVTADASASTDMDLTPIASYSFDFGDGSATVGPQSGATATHRFDTAGTYTVTVTVTDTGGNSSTASTQVTVTAPPDLPPAAVLAVTPASGTAPLQVTADASGSTDTDVTPIASYKFTFGDGSAAVGPQSGATASHTYTTPGTYTVTLTATDTGGQSSTATQQVTVNPPDLAPASVLTVSPASGPAPLAVTADASGSTDNDATPIASYKFDFGDGSGSAIVGPQGAATATHTYAATTTTTYTVKVTVTDTVGNASTTTKPVTVYPNLATNGGFESGLTGWNTSGGGTGITLQQAAGGHSGSSAVKVWNGNTTNQTALLNDSPNWVAKTSAGQYTGSLWVRADTAGATLNLRFREYSTSGTLLGTKTVTAALTTNWQQVTVTLPVTTVGSTFDFNAFVSNAAPNSGFYADDATIYNG